MLNMRKWRKRLLKAWHEKVKARKMTDGPKEIVTRKQGNFHVTLFLWDDKHAWHIMPLRPNGRPAILKQIRVQVDTPISQEAVFRWLEKTKPVE